MLYEIAKEGPWTLHELTYRTPWQAVLMMLRDRGRLRKRRAEDEEELLEGDDEERFMSTQVNK
jgi:hypothetical protein